jgi:hypothetical protein
MLFAFVFLLPLPALHAQIEERALMTVNIPFAFTVENTRLPAGHYVVYSELGYEWKLNSFGKGGSAFFRITPDQARHLPSIGKLVFHRYETEYVLHEIHPSDRSVIATLPEGKAEKELARHAAQPELAMVYAENGTQTSAQANGR